MVMLLSFLGLEGQTSSSLEDDGIDDGHLHNSPRRKGGRWSWSYPFFLRSKRADLFLVFFAAYRVEEDLGLGGHQGCC